MSRTVADAAAMLAVITGPDMRDRLSIPCGDVDWIGAVQKGRDGIKGLKVAYSADWGYAPVDPDVRRIVGEAVKVLHQRHCWHLEREGLPSLWLTTTRPAEALFSELEKRLELKISS